MTAEPTYPPVAPPPNKFPTPTPTATPTATATVEQQPTAPPPDLPVTGADAAALFFIAGGLITMGILLALAHRGNTRARGFVTWLGVIATAALGWGAVFLIVQLVRGVWA